MYNLRLDGKIIKSHVSEDVIAAMWSMLGDRLIFGLGCSMHVCSEPNAILLKTPKGRVIGLSYDNVAYHGVHHSDVEFYNDPELGTLQRIKEEPEYELCDSDYYTLLDHHLMENATKIA